MNTQAEWTLILGFATLCAKLPALTAEERAEEIARFKRRTVEQRLSTRDIISEAHKAGMLMGDVLASFVKLPGDNINVLAQRDDNPDITMEDRLRYIGFTEEEIQDLLSDET